MMKQFCSILAIAIVCITENSAQSYAIGSCPSIPVINDFNLDQYKGSWFEYSKFPNTFEYGLKCNTATYGDAFMADGTLDSTKVTVVNDGKQAMFTINPSMVEGYATFKDPSKPNQLQVSFNIKFLGFGLFDTMGDYNVLDTDYNNYSLVYTCSERSFWFFTLKTEYAWFLTRSLNVTEETMNTAMGKLAMFTDVSKLEMADHTDCN